MKNISKNQRYKQMWSSLYKKEMEIKYMQVPLTPQEHLVTTKYFFFDKCC